MKTLSTAVLGGGMAGLSAALALARAGHRVALIERDTIDYTHADGGAYPFFTYAATGISPLADGDVFRAVVRRNTFLDPLRALDDDPPMQRRLERFYSDLAAAARPRPGPARDELLAVMTAAVRDQGT